MHCASGAEEKMKRGSFIYKPDYPVGRGYPTTLGVQYLFSFSFLCISLDHSHANVETCLWRRRKVGSAKRAQDLRCGTDITNPQLHSPFTAHPSLFILPRLTKCPCTLNSSLGPASYIPYSYAPLVIDNRGAYPSSRNDNSENFGPPSNNKDYNTPRKCLPPITPYSTTLP